MIWLDTLSGARPDPLHPRAADIVLTDVAHGLARPRWLRQTRTDITIAEHSLHVGRVARELATGTRTDPDIAELAGCIHDTGEYLVPDMPSPIKRFAYFVVDGEIVSYADVERRIFLAFVASLGLPRWCCGLDRLDTAVAQYVRQADLVVLATEARDLLHGTAHWENLMPTPMADRLAPMAAGGAEALWLARVRDLVAKLGGQA